MILNKSQLLLSEIKLVEKSFQLNWDFDQDSICEKDEYFIFGINYNGETYQFDVVFDLYATCTWIHEAGSWDQPAYSEQSDPEFSVKVTSIISEDCDIDLSLEDLEIKAFVENLIINEL